MSKFQERYEDYLMHYGIKGMKWGVRKKTYKSLNKYQRRVLRGVATAAAEREKMHNMDKGVQSKYNRKISKYKSKGNTEKVAKYEAALKDWNDSLKRANSTVNAAAANVKDSLKLDNYDVKNAAATQRQREAVWDSFFGIGSGHARGVQDSKHAYSYFDAEKRYKHNPDGTYEFKKKK